MNRPTWSKGNVVETRAAGIPRGPYRLVRKCGTEGDWYLSRDLSGTAPDGDFDAIAHEQTFTVSEGR